MSTKELKRVELLEQVETGRRTRKEVAKELGITVRQIDQLRKRKRQDGAGGLAHRNRGRPSNNKLVESVREKVIEILTMHYNDFGPTLAREKLIVVHGIKLGKETVRQLMKGVGLWKAKKRKGKKYHPRRDRREHYGELVQSDGSDHDWFEKRGPRRTLVAMIDDATNITYGRFSTQK